MESKCRFLKEYANFKKRKIKEDILLNTWEAQAQIDGIDKILRRANRGLITLDEAMEEISKVGRW